MVPLIYNVPDIFAIKVAPAPIRTKYAYLATNNTSLIYYDFNRNTRTILIAGENVSPSGVMVALPVEDAVELVQRLYEVKEHKITFEFKINNQLIFYFQ